jgi:glyoxylase-like metal-dependent hydrolase (beta-lactamase superfamily II)
MDKPYRSMPDVEVIPSHFPLPGAGFLPVNSFVLKAKEPVLVDTGMGIDSEGFLEALESIISPRDLKWVWLTHDDADHTGNIRKVMEAAPGARLAANALAALRLSTAWPLPLDRVYWLNPGDSFDAGDRKLTAVRPPLFDNPTTIGLYDDKSEAFFSADCFGALIPLPSARNVDEVTEEDLAQGMISWASGDSPWVHMVEAGQFNRTLDKILQLAPKGIFSAHLPPALGKTERLLELLSKVPASTPFVAPNQTALEQMSGGS